MINLVRPTLEHNKKYKEMIKEWQENGGPYVPCIIKYDCQNPLDQLDYNAVLKVVDDYSKGKIFDYDREFFDSSDFYFIFDDEELIGMGEIRHNLKPLGIKIKGNITCGIRPSKRNKGYASKSIEYMIEKLKDDKTSEVIICHESEDNIIPNIMKKLDFKYRNNIFYENCEKEIKCYTKDL